MKLYNLIDSILIGINLWLIPQISEHCPYIIDGLLIINLKLFNWFGIESILMLIDGIVHEWITSIDVIDIIIW